MSSQGGGGNSFHFPHQMSSHPDIHLLLQEGEGEGWEGRSLLSPEVVEGGEGEEEGEEGEDCAGREQHQEQQQHQH